MESKKNKIVYWSRIPFFVCVFLLSNFIVVVSTENSLPLAEGS